MQPKPAVDPAAVQAAETPDQTDPIEEIREKAKGYLEELIDDVRRLPIEHRKAGGEALADGVKRGMGDAFVLFANAATREALVILAKASILSEPAAAGGADQTGPTAQAPVVIDYDADPYAPVQDAEEPAPAPRTGPEIHAQLEAERRIDALKSRRRVR